MYVYEVLTLNSVEYATYATIEMADEYLNASMSEAAVAWRDLSDADDKSRYLIQMTRIIERQEWIGEKVDAGQSLAWPRKNTGLTDVTDDVIPAAIENACIEGAALLVTGADFESTQNQSQKISSMQAGSTSMSFFRGAEGRPTRFPLPVQELLKRYLAGSTFSVGAISYGTSAESVTADPLDRSRPL